MANNLTIQHKRSSTPGNQPNAANLSVGELAINLADRYLFTKDSGGNVVQLGIQGGSAWTTQTSGISRADRVMIGADSDPSTALDVVGAITTNVQTTTGAIDVSTGQVWEITVSAPTTISVTGTFSGSTTLVLNIINGGSSTITWPASFKWDGGTAPTTLSASSTDIIVATTNDGGTNWYSSVFALGFM